MPDASLDYVIIPPRHYTIIPQRGITAVAGTPATPQVIIRAHYCIADHMPALRKRPIQRRKLSDEVFDQLIALIGEEGYRPGDQMPAERDLMDTFGVGRPVVREAMQRLAAIGMIVIQHGERARIGEVGPASVFNQIDLPARLMLSSSRRNVAHLQEARLFVEAGLVRLAAERATPDDLVRLRKAFAEMQRQQGGAGFVAADMAFHVQIAHVSGNPIFVAGCQAMLQWIADYGTDMLRAKGQQQTLDEHERILERMAAHDPDGAEAAMREHLARPVGAKPAPGNTTRRTKTTLDKERST